ncbi:MAG: acetyl-CoA hydrolase/transferase family protein [Geminicoccaceae bacterium]
MTVFVQGSSSEPTDLIRSLVAAPEASDGVHYVSCQIPGLNRCDLAGLHPNTCATGLFVTPEAAASYQARKFRFMPLSYSGMYDYLASLKVDIALIQVGKHGGSDAFTLGSSIHFVPAVLKQAEVVIAELNECLPKPGRSLDLEAGRLDYIVPVDHELPSLNTDLPSSLARKIGAHIAGLVSNGDSLQVGIGKIPSAILDRLHGHKQLACHGGLVSESMIDLHDVGALDPTRPIICTSVIGSKRVYDWVDGREHVHVLPVTETHSVLRIAEIERFVAVNSVLSVDLAGQANAETINGRQVGGSGGLSDFMRGARMSRKGRSILALPSTAGGGKISRIVNELTSDIASCPRVDADYVVTEHGIAALRNKSLDERALALISIAEPAFRQDLERAWERRRSEGAA